MRYINILMVIMFAVIVTGCATTVSTGKPEAVAVPYRLDAGTRSRYKQAVSLVREGKNAKAEKILRSLVKSKPKLAGPYANLAIVHLRSNRLDKAENMISQAVKNNPGNAEYHNLRGIISRQQGKFTDAEASYLKAIAISPGVADYRLNLGILYDLYLYEHKKALEQYRKYQQIKGKEDRKVAGWIIDLGRRMQ